MIDIKKWHSRKHDKKAVRNVLGEPWCLGLDFPNKVSQVQISSSYVFDKENRIDMGFKEKLGLFCITPG